MLFASGTRTRTSVGSYADVRESGAGDPDGVPIKSTYAVTGGLPQVEDAARERVEQVQALAKEVR